MVVIPQQFPWVFLLKMIILGCEMGIPPFKEPPKYTWKLWHGAEVRLSETMEVSDLHEGWGLKNLPTWTPTTHEIHEGVFSAPKKRGEKKKPRN